MSAVINIDRARQERDVSNEPEMGQGYTRIVNELIEALAMAPLGAGHFRVMYAVIRQTYGWNKTKDRISGGQLAGMTGMKRQTCNRLVRELVGMNLIQRGDDGVMRINTCTTSWDLEARPRHTRQGIPETGTHVGSTHKEGSTGTDVRSTPGTDVRSTTGTDGGTHKRQERQGKTEGGGQTPSSADADPRADDSQSGEEPESTSQRDPVPYQAIVDAYHEILPELPAVQKLTPARRKAIRARWNDTYGANARPGNNLDFWRRYFWHVKRSRFLCGLKDGDRPWRASLDFLFRESTMVRIIEGVYHQGDDYREMPGDNERKEGGEHA